MTEFVAQSPKSEEFAVRSETRETMSPGLLDFAFAHTRVSTGEQHLLAYEHEERSRGGTEEKAAGAALTGSLLEAIA